MVLEVRLAVGLVKRTIVTGQGNVLVLDFDTDYLSVLTYFNSLLMCENPVISIHTIYKLYFNKTFT